MVVLYVKLKPVAVGIISDESGIPSELCDPSQEIRLMHKVNPLPPNHLKTPFHRSRWDSATLDKCARCFPVCRECLCKKRCMSIVQRFARCLKLVTHVGSDLVVNARPTRSHRRSDQLYIIIA